VIAAASPQDVEFFCKEVQYAPTTGARGVVFKTVTAAIAAMALYDHWTPNSVNVHIYSSSPKHLFDREFTHAIFHYPFVQCGKGLLIGITPSSHESSLAVSRYLGFREVYRMKDAWAEGIDMIVKEMRKEECQWLRKEKIA
jgi:hypothetical protein